MKSQGRPGQWQVNGRTPWVRFSNPATDEARSFFATCFFLSCSGCFGGDGGGGSVGTPAGVVRGSISEVNPSSSGMVALAGLTASSPGVEGASVTLIGTNRVAATNYMGSFTLSGVSPGVYDLIVRKNGWPSVGAYGVVVSENRAAELNLKMVRLEGYHPQELEPPTLFLECPPRISGSAYIHVTAGDDSGVAAALMVDGQWVSGQDATITTNSKLVPQATLTWRWDTRSSDPSGAGDWSNGGHVITAVAIDGQGNLSFRSMEVEVYNPQAPGPIPAAPVINSSLMLTAHYSALDLIEKLLVGLPGSRSGADKPLLATWGLGGVKAGMRPRTTPGGSDSVVIGQVGWLYSSFTEVSGFKIYRDGVFAANIPGVNLSSWGDGSAKLSPGRAVTYQVSAYNRAGEGARSNQISRTPLAPLRKVGGLTVLGAGAAPAVPIFQWQPVYGAEIYVVDVLDSSGNLMWEGYIMAGEGTSIVYGDISHTIVGPAQYPLPQGTYTCYVMAARTTPSTAGGPPSYPWVPEAISLSASDIATFTVW